ADEAERRQTVGLTAGADLLRPDLEQPLAPELEEASGVLVRVDEAILVDVENHDRLGCILDERAIALLALAKRVLVLDALGDVAHAQHVEVLAPARRGADRDLRREGAAVCAPRAERRRREVDDRVLGAFGERAELLAGRAE